jgi:hypothetical protein
VRYLIIQDRKNPIQTGRAIISVVDLGATTALAITIREHMAVIDYMTLY